MVDRGSCPVGSLVQAKADELAAVLDATGAAFLIPGLFGSQLPQAVAQEWRGRLQEIHP